MAPLYELQHGAELWSLAKHPLRLWISLDDIYPAIILSLDGLLKPNLDACIALIIICSLHPEITDVGCLCLLPRHR